MAVDEEQRLLDARFIHIPMYGQHPSIQSYATPIQKNWKGEGRGLASYPGSSLSMRLEGNVKWACQTTATDIISALKSWADTMVMVYMFY